MTGDSSLRIRLLGTFEVLVGRRAIDDSEWKPRKTKQLVKLLVLSRRHRLHRDQLMEWLWPESDPLSAGNNLNKTLHLARHVLEPQLKTGSDSSYLMREDSQIVLNSPGTLWVDSEVFEDMAQKARRSSDVQKLEAALELYRGDLLPDDRYEDWAWESRERLRQLYLDVLLHLAGVYAESGQQQPSVECLTELLRKEPTNEEAHRALMRLHASMGRRQKALAQYERCRRVLQAELDAEPEPATEKLHQDILTGELGLQSGPPSSKEVDSVAVLPLENTGGDHELDYLCNGITEGMINRLAKVPHIRLIAYSTVSKYRDSTADPLTVGRELSVRAVVVGRAQQRGGRLRVGVEMVDVSDGTRLWGEQFERPESAILAVEEEISREISSQLRVTLSGTQRQALYSRHTRSTRAYHDYLRGRFHWNKRTAKSLRDAIVYFNRAIERDPAYARAYAGLADCYNLLGLYSPIPPAETMPRAKAAAAQALEMDRDLAEAHTSLAYSKLYYDWNWEEAERLFQRAIELQPNYATAHHWYHEYLTAMGRFDEERVAVRRAEELDPLSLIINTEVGWGLYFARHYDRATRRLRNTLALDPTFAVAHFVLGLAYLQKGNYLKALAETESALQLLAGEPFPLALGMAGHIYARSGRHSDARRVLDQLNKLGRRAYVSPYVRSLIHVALDESEAALDALEEACRDRYDRLIYLNVEPIFDPLRKAPRFRALLKSIGLPTGGQSSLPLGGAKVHES